MSLARLTREKAIIAILPFGIWLVIFLANAAQPIFEGTLDWDMAVVASWAGLGKSAALSLLAYGLAVAFPLERGKLHWRIPLHVVAFVGLIALVGWWERSTDPFASRLARTLAANAERRPRTDMPPPPLLRDPPPLPMAGMPPRPRPGRGPEIRRLLEGLAASRWQLHMLVYLATFGVVHAAMFYLRAEERQRKALELTASLSKAKLEALRLQLQPHFLFNTLNAISTLVHNNPDAADEMIATLSDLLRLSLDITEQEVPLRRELEILDRYLEIEQVRLGERLRVVRAIDDGVLDARVPSLLLQPIVENAVRHGIEPRLAPGTITLRAARAGDRLRLAVCDDGIGLKTADTRSERRGIGLANTEARLRELYGDAGRLTLREPAERGVSVEIEIPFRPAAANAV